MRWMSRGAALAGMAMIAAPAWADDRFASCVGRVALISAYHSTASGQGYAGVVLTPRRAPSGSMMAGYSCVWVRSAGWA